MENKNNKKKILSIAIPVAVVLVAAVAVIMMFVLKPDTEVTPQEHMENAEQFVIEGEYGKAISAYDMVLEEEPENFKAIKGKIDAYLSMGNEKKAVDVMVEAISLIETIYKREAKVPEETTYIYYRYADIKVASGDSKGAKYLLEQGSQMVDKLLDNYANPDFDPGTDKAVLKDDKIIFGSYPQNEIPSEKVSDNIINADYSDTNKALVEGTGYYRIQEGDTYRYFVESNISWDIINEDDNGYLLMTTYAIDGVAYDTEYKESDWSTCYLRSWLIEDFLTTAFNEEQRTYLNEMEVNPSRNPDYGIVTGAYLKDTVTILSAEEVSEGANGFEGDRKAYEEKRITGATAYAEARGVHVDSSGVCKWWLRTCGVDVKSAIFVNTNGVLACDGYYVMGNDIGVRPVIYLSKDAFEN